MIMLRFDLAGLTDRAVDMRQIKKCVQVFGSVAKIKTAKSFSLAFVDAKTIKKFNRVYRGKNKTTDVLSFADRDSDFISPGEERELGEILICLSRAKSQARSYGWTLDREICRLLVHGLAHLVGYEHEGVSKKEEEKMIKFEKKIMNNLPLTSSRNFLTKKYPGSRIN